MDIVRETFNKDPTPEQIALVMSTLSHDEEKWKGRHEMLKHEGFELRPRLRPGWKPSWIESGADPLDCEDGELLPVGCFADHSIRHSDKSVAAPHACGCHP